MTDIAFLDGGLGQEIHKRSNNDAHPLWSVKVMFDQPNIVTKVHSDFIQSGSRVICLNTYTATQSRMTLNGFGEQLEIAHKTAIKLAKQMGPGKTIVTILCDHGKRYASKIFNKEFLKSKNLPIPKWL